MTASRNTAGVPAKLIVFAVLAGLVPAPAWARCIPFDLLDSVGRIPLLVHGKVSGSNKADIVAARCMPEVCRHRFDISVIATLKGNITADTLHVSYDYVQQRPEIALFSDGDDYVFALSKVAADGQATLLGTTCGRSGLGAESIDRLLKALGK